MKRREREAGSVSRVTNERPLTGRRRRAQKNLGARSNRKFAILYLVNKLEGHPVPPFVDTTPSIRGEPTTLKGSNSRYVPNNLSRLDLKVMIRNGPAAEKEFFNGESSSR